MKGVTEMRRKELKIFTRFKGIETLTRKEFLENLDLGLYDGVSIEIIETYY